MDQIANLVIDLGIDAAEFKNEIPRIKNLLNGAASDAERSSARMQRFMERQTQAARQTTQAASSAATAASVHAQTVEKNAQAHERMAREVEKTRQRMEALSQKMREEQAQAMALAEAQDKAAAAFYRQIDSVKQASAGLQELQRIQQQIRQARNSGGIGQQDYLALISEVTAKTRVLTQAEEEATRQKVAFIRQLKEQATRQNLSSSELLRAKAAQLGVSSAAEVYIRKMEQAGKATHSLGLKSAAARQEIGVLIGELARGNLGALRGSGITLANRAGWIDTLMSPKGMMLGGVIGGIAAAVYGLGKAWYDGQKEGEEFNRQLSLTGHYAGVTAGQLWTLSRAISGNGITQHAAAGALAQVVGSGAFRGNDIGMVARAAAQMERSVGQSVSDTINQFKRLKDDPVNAAKALDNELHFLTATQLEQIRVLGDQGRSSDAARIAASINIKPGHDYYFYVRSVNTVGKSAFVEAVGRASDDAEGYLDFFKGKITESHLGKELLEKVELTEDNASRLEEFSKEWKDANDKWNAMWAVKIEQTKDGKHYVAGIGLSMEDTEEGKLSQFLVAANRIAFIDPANGNETPMFVAQGNQIFMNDVFLKRLTAPTITSGGSPPVFSLTSDGKLTAKNADISGSVNANAGTLNNVTVNENCTIKGMLEATQVRGDFVKAVSKSFPKQAGTWGNTETPNGTVTVTISDDHNFDRQIIIPPIIFNGIAYSDPGSGNNPGGTRYTGYGFEVRKNGVLIASRETKGAIPGSYSAVIDMPSGRGSVTLEFKVFHKGNQWAGNITDCTVIVTKKAASGISIR